MEYRTEIIYYPRVTLLEKLDSHTIRYFFCASFQEATRSKFDLFENMRVSNQ